MPEKYEQSVESSKQETKNQYRDTLQTLGNLSEQEINELVDFEFHTGASSPEEQVRRYYLKLKSEEPEKAEQMKADTDAIIQKGITTQKDVKNLCFALYKYRSGIIVYFKNHSYSVHNGKLNVDEKEVS